MKIKLKYAITACIVCFLSGLVMMFVICEKEIWYWNIRKKQKELQVEIEKIKQERPLIEKDIENLKLKFENWTNELERSLRWDEPIYKQVESEGKEEERR